MLSHHLRLQCLPTLLTDLQSSPSSCETMLEVLNLLDSRRMQPTRCLALNDSLSSRRHGTACVGASVFALGPAVPPTPGPTPSHASTEGSPPMRAVVFDTSSMPWCHDAPISTSPSVKHTASCQARSSGHAYRDQLLYPSGWPASVSWSGSACGRGGSNASPTRQLLLGLARGGVPPAICPFQHERRSVALAKAAQADKTSCRCERRVGMDQGRDRG